MSAEPELTFAGTIPDAYERLLGPVIFEPYAADMAERVTIRPGIRILELAAGTGRLTRRLLDRLPEDGALVAIDLSPAMLAVAQFRLSDPRVEWQTADATDLAFEDASFDVIACQFGVMFFPDKSRAYQEALRVLRPGGTLLFSAWGSHARNPWARVMHRTMQECFPNDTEPLLEKPFAYNDEAFIRQTLSDAGFIDLELAWVEFPLICESAAMFARGFATGTPLLDGIGERGGDVETCISALAQAFRTEFGEAPMRTTMAALVVAGKRPAV